jgi:hypothetical protein
VPVTKSPALHSAADSGSKTQGEGLASEGSGEGRRRQRDERGVGGLGAQAQKARWRAATHSVSLE